MQLIYQNIEEKQVKKTLTNHPQKAHQGEVLMMTPRDKLEIRTRQEGVQMGTRFTHLVAIPHMIQNTLREVIPLIVQKALVDLPGVTLLLALGAPLGLIPQQDLRGVLQGM